VNKWVFLTVLAVVFGVHTASAYRPCMVVVVDQQEQIQWAIAAWRSGVSHSRVRVKQLGPPLELEVVPSVVLYLRDRAGNPTSGLRYTGSSRGPTREMLKLQRGMLELQLRDQWFNYVME
jgi:hypothetical protein